nr:MAG: RNA-dependent RNA polymerase [Phenuiviridae sp.]
MSRPSSINEICSRSKPDRAFHHPPARLFECGSLPPIPAYDARVVGDEILIKFSPIEPIESASMTGSSIGESYSLRVPASQTFIHDFTYGVWTDSTDQKLRDHFALMRDGDDLLTPDYITSISPTEKVVVEFSTVKYSQAGILAASFNKKAVKYTRALQARSTEECRVTFLVVVASSNFVYTNMDIHGPEIDELCFRHRVAIDLASHLSKQGIVFEGMGDETRLTREVKTLFESMKVDWSKLEKDFPQMTEEMYHSWLEAPSVDYVRELTETLMGESYKHVQKETQMFEILHSELLLKKAEEARAKINEYRDMVDCSAERDASRHKSTIPFPPWVPKVLKSSDSSLKAVRNLPGMVPTGITEGRLWSSVLHSIATDNVEIANENTQVEYLEAMELLVVEEEEKKKKRSKYRRAPLNLTREEEVDLACKGFSGKAHRHNSRVKDARKLSKQTFKLSTDTRDIEHFIHTDPDVFDSSRSQELYPELREAFLNIEKSHAMHGINETHNHWTQKSKQFYESPLGVWLTMVTAIAVELAASVRQNCKKKQVVVKKLRMFNVFLIIKPTNSTSHIFFTLAVPKSELHCALSQSEVFKGYHEAGAWYFTELHSFKIPKLTNLTRAMSCIHNLYWFFRDFHGVNFFQDMGLEEVNGLREAEKMTKVAMLVFFEDKARTEEIITQSRYIFMEGFVALPAAPKPEKMIKKLPTFCRTKLQVWLINRFLLATMRIIKEPFMPIPVDGKAKWTNLFNMFTGSPVENPKRLISLFYLGYLKNKEESPDKNANSKLYEKILEEEDKHSGRREFLGLDDPPIGDVRPHEYSPSLIKTMAQFGIILLERDYGTSVMERIEDDIDVAISSISLDDMATLKASSSFGPELYTTAHEKPYHRKKVATALMPMVRGDNTHLHHILTECLEKVESRGGIHACIFKKQQHGGIREIYVLGIEERVVQLTYETIMKQICKYFKSETLMNPKQKHIIPSSHGYIASKICGGMVFTVCSSDDQSRWNQTQHVTKFAAMAVNLLPKKYHPFILRASALFMRKRLMIDPALLKIMRSVTELKTASPIFQRMHAAYNGNAEERWLKKGEAFITTETGMMQGILHYTSSLMHTLFLELYRDFSLKRMTKECLEAGDRAHMDILQSSDDSSVLLSFPSEPRDSSLKCRYFALILFEFKKRLGRYIGIEASPKSTSGTPFMVEFNSEFFFHNNHYRPEIRWIAAADLVCEHESLASRQEEMSNNLTSVLEGGCSLSLTAFCQIGQAILHYTLLGMTTTGLFFDFCREARWSSDPSLGFFLMDHPFAAGAVGFKYNLWVACKKSRLGPRYAHLLQQVKSVEENVAKEDRPTRFASLDTTRTGTFTGSVGVQWGDRKKWLAELEKMDLPKNYLEVTDEKPEILYERASTSEAVRLKVAEKMHSPGVTESLSSGNSVNRVIAASVYCLSQRVMTNTSEWLDTREEHPEKHSLLFYVHKTNRQVSSDGPVLTQEQERLLFPLSEEYERIKNNLSELTSIRARRIIDSRPIVQTRISLVETEKFLRCAPIDLVCDMWFGTSKVNMTRQAVAEEWEHLKAVLPWLSINAKKTLEDSPFNHHCQLRNFLARMRPKGRMVHIVGAPIKRSSGMSNLMTAIRDNFFPGYTLTESFDQFSRERADRAALLRHYIYMALTSPLKDEEIFKVVKDVLTGCPAIGYSPDMKKSKLTNLAILQDWQNGTSHELTLRRIEASGSGVIGGYTHQQLSRKEGKDVVYEGDGEWSGLVEGVRVTIYIGKGPVSEVTNFNQVVLDREMEADCLLRFLKQWAQEHNVANIERARISLVPRTMGNRIQFYMHKMKLTLQHVPGCIPIYVADKSAHRRAGLRCDRPLVMQIRNRTINLRAFDGRGYSNILSYTANDAEANEVIARGIRDELNTAQQSGVSHRLKFLNREPSRSWFSMSKMNPETVTTVLKGIFGKDVRPERISLDRFKTQNMLRELSSNSLRRAGVGLSDLGTVARLRDTADDDQPSTSKKKTEVPSLGELWGQVMLFDDELVQGPPIVEWAQLAPVNSTRAADYLDADPMSAEEFNLNAFGSDYMRQDYTNRFYEHPLLDAEIEDMTSRFPVREITAYLRTKKVSSKRRAEVLRLNLLLGLDDKEIIFVEEEPELGPVVTDAEQLG